MEVAMTDEQPRRTTKFLFTITGVFRIKGRGTVIAGMVDSDWKDLRRGDQVEVRDGERVVLATQIVGVEMFMVDPPPQKGHHAVGVLISKSDVPEVKEGQSLWKVEL